MTADRRCPACGDVIEAETEDRLRVRYGKHRVMEHGEPVGVLG